MCSDGRAWISREKCGTVDPIRILEHIFRVLNWESVIYNMNLLLFPSTPLLDISIVSRAQESESQAKVNQLLCLLLSSGKELEFTCSVLSGNETKALMEHMDECGHIISVLQNICKPEMLERN